MTKRFIRLSRGQEHPAKCQFQPRLVLRNVQRTLKQRRGLREIAGRLGASSVALGHAGFQRASAKGGRVVDVALKRVELSLSFGAAPKTNERGAEREPCVLVRRIERERLP